MTMDKSIGIIAITTVRTVDSGTATPTKLIVVHPQPVVSCSRKVVVAKVDEKEGCNLRESTDDFKDFAPFNRKRIIVMAFHRGAGYIDLAQYDAS